MTLIMSHHIHIIHSVICNNNTTYLQLLYTLTSHITMHYMYCAYLSLNDWGNLQPRFRTFVYTSQYNGKVALPNSISLSYITSIYHSAPDYGMGRRRSLFANVEKKLQWQAASTGWSPSKLAANNKNTHIHTHTMKLWN